MYRLATSAMVLVLVLASRPAVAAESGQEAQDLRAIRAAVDSYVAAYNRGDAKVVAEHWSETGRWISPSGRVVQGRKAIEEEMKAILAENPGIRLEVLNPRIRFVTADVAIEEGTARVLRPGQPPDDSGYLAIHAKKDGKWRLDSVRETELPAVPAGEPYEHLKELEWMVGDWTDQSKVSTVETVCQWAKNRSFLLRTFKLSAPGTEELEGTQVVGWDPVKKVIRSWVFDSDGGYLEGTWTHKGDTWVVKAAGFLADGQTASSVNVFKYVDPNTFTWRAFGRKVDGQFAPDIPETKVIRKRPAR
jgi:uncharacterized protein (TIGR02246 family)